MARRRFTVTLAAVTLFSALVAGIPAGSEGAPLGGKTYGEYYVKSLPKQNLTRQEIEDLIHMREEEKLARDVYLTLSKRYRLPVFRNIARSEERHMKMVGLLLKKYNIPDPVAETGDRIGVFKSPELQKLYNELVQRGSKSLIDALKVGATIEDLDIKDLEEALARTDNEDIRTVSQNLMKGSRNHMRAFVRLLRAFGSNYTPQYISVAEFNRIVNSEKERGFYNSSGRLSMEFRRIEGTVVNVTRVPGFRRKSNLWWEVEVNVGGEKVKVRIAPTWWYPSINVRPGDTVEVQGFVPPYWKLKGFNGIVGCKFQDKSTGVTYDFSKFRKFCKKLSP